MYVCVHLSWNVFFRFLHISNSIFVFSHYYYFDCFRCVRLSIICDVVTRKEGGSNSSCCCCCRSTSGCQVTTFLSLFLSLFLYSHFNICLQFFSLIFFSILFYFILSSYGDSCCCFSFQLIPLTVLSFWWKQSVPKFKNFSIFFFAVCFHIWLACQWNGRIIALNEWKFLFERKKKKWRKVKKKNVPNINS